jgi:hypothetical protein
MLSSAVLALLFQFAAGESFSEHLIVHQITGGYFPVTFASEFVGSTSVHGHIFPRPIASLFDTYPVNQFKLTLTRGRWKQEWYALLRTHSRDVNVHRTACDVLNVASHYYLIPL